MKVSLLSILLRVVLVGACLYGVHLLLQEAHLHEAWLYIMALPAWKIGLALASVAGSYIALVFYDTLACKYVRAKVPFSSIATTAVLANAVSNMVGFALLSGGAVRMRCYNALGVPGTSVMKISLFCTATFLLGLLLSASLGLVFDSALFVPVLGLDTFATHMAGGLLLALCLALPLLVHKKRVLHWRLETYHLPSASLMWGQYLVGLVDILATGSVAYLLLPAGHGFGFLAFISVFSAALWLGLISHVPGGLGVFEAVMLAGLGTQIPPSELLGALLIYRLLYYAVPFVLAVAVLAFVEGHAVAHKLKENVRPPARALFAFTRSFLPMALAGLTAFAGLVLLVSSATPAVHSRMEMLAEYLPISLIEGSHLMGSIVGFAMLFVARGIYNRYDSAYPAALLLLASGIVFSLVKGLDYEEATFLALVFPVVVAARSVFYRPSKVSMLELSLGWWVFIAVSLTGLIWLLFFAYKRVDYENFLWWQIALGLAGDASRSLRSVFAIVMVALVVGVNQLFRPARPVLAAPTPEDLADARRIIGVASSTNAYLALTGDKVLLFSTPRDAFIMFRQTMRSLIAMGDPVGNPASFAALIWRLRELADRHKRRLAFYQVSTDCLTYYIDAGMQFARLGEEAIIDLAGFSLDGGRYKQIRQTLTRGEREGLQFALVPVEEVPSLEPALASLSQEWLATRRTREKSFSLGFYSRAYIERFPIAVVRWNGRLVAFANVWATDNKRELSVDLMRHSADAPQGTMDFLFGHLLVWGQAQGYAHFNLGMAPMVGFISHRLAPLWTKWGAFVYAHGERFYRFKGLHAFKNKYHPQWRPRYMAYTGGSVPSLLVEVAILIAGGIKGLFRK